MGEKEMKMLNEFKVKVNREESKKLQEVLFENGYGWNGHKEIEYLDCNYIYSCNQRLFLLDDEHYFNKCQYKELAVEFILGFYSSNIEPHTSTIRKQIENPNLATDKEIEQVINEEYEKDSLINKDKQDMINPSHYKKGGIETIDYMKAKSTPEEFKGHLRLTALKYLSRYGQKDNELQELEKAKWYLDRLIQELKNEN
jgi:hypothetical protein